MAAFHFAPVAGSARPLTLGFVVQHGGRRIVLTGDFLRVPDEDNSLLFDADVMFLDANTWHPAEWTWHQSVLGNLRLIDKWRPKRAYLIHYSGYEDREHVDEPVHGPMDRERFVEELGRIAADRDLRLPRHGMILGCARSRTRGPRGLGASQESGGRRGVGRDGGA
jgi:L-ascorbate metabolism protein UlaG (beta-lactamase superfamily)